MRDCDEILDDLFHGGAWAAYISLAHQTGAWRECESARRLAFRDYEGALAKNHRQRDEIDKGDLRDIRCGPSLSSL
jgi:hypothetical protein